MFRRRTSLSFLVLSLTLSTLLSGCVRYSRYMHPIAQPRTITAPPDAAVVVFLRPAGVAPADLEPIIDEAGNFLGDISARSYFAVRMAPGHHTFIAWSENTDAIGADLAPGRVYYVQVFLRMGAFSARVHMEALRPGSEPWGQLEHWLASTQQLEPDTAAGAAMVRDRQAQWQERIRRGEERVQRYDGEQLALHTLAPGDGQ